jgi:predicted RNA-binding Zn-ribbon protein involved in translation (DUF1610 family)
LNINKGKTMLCPKCDNEMIKLTKRKLEEQYPLPVCSSKSASVYLYEDFEIYECPMCNALLLVPKIFDINTLDKQ